MGRKSSGPVKQKGSDVYYARLRVILPDGKLKRLVRSLGTTDVAVAEKRWVDAMRRLEREATDAGCEVNSNWRERAGLQPLTSVNGIAAFHKTDPWSGYVYVLRSRVNKRLYKIGITRNDRLLARLKELKVGDAVDLVVTHSFDDYREREKSLHQEFADFRLPQSEWFSLSDDQLRRMVAALMAPSQTHSPC